MRIWEQMEWDREGGVCAGNLGGDRWGTADILVVYVEHRRSSIMIVAYGDHDDESSRLIADEPTQTILARSRTPIRSKEREAEHECEQV